jgi:archaemetzincin
MNRNESGFSPWQGNSGGRHAQPGILAQVIPLGAVDQVACHVVGANLEAVMGLPSLLEPPMPEPMQFYLPIRRQFDAEPILDELARLDLMAPLKIGITESDLGLSILAYVYGEALVGGGAALVSLYRLRDMPGGQHAPQDLVYERLAKVACHETAHAMGLEHCREAGCLMRLSGGLTHLDELRLWFCPVCGRELAHRRDSLLQC